MNDQISWDSSLVKKFSSSNHFKLLNQLRNEVKKYPLNYNKNKSLNIRKDNNIDTKNIPNSSNSQNMSPNKENIINNEQNSNQSTVSFNNSKNFSIYKNTTDKLSNIEKEEISLTVKNSNEEALSSSFKDRLDQIEMK